MSFKTNRKNHGTFRAWKLGPFWGSGYNEKLIRRLYDNHVANIGLASTREDFEKIMEQVSGSEVLSDAQKMSLYDLILKKESQ